MECPRPIKSVLCRFYPTWSSRTRPSMRIQRSEGLGSRLGGEAVPDPTEGRAEGIADPIGGGEAVLDPTVLLSLAISTGK